MWLVIWYVRLIQYLLGKTVFQHMKVYETR